MKSYEKSSVHFMQKPWKKFVQLLLNIFFFFCWRPKKFPDRFCHHNMGSVNRAWATISSKFFLIILMPGIQRITLSIKDVFHNHWKVMKNLRYILCSCFWTYYFLATVSERKCAADIIFILKIIWLLLKTFQCFLKNVRQLLKRY